MSEKYKSIGSVEGFFVEQDPNEKQKFLMRCRGNVEVTCCLAPSLVVEAEQALRDNRRAALRGAIEYEERDPVLIQAMKIYVFPPNSELPKLEDLYGTLNLQVRSDVYIRAMRDGIDLQDREEAN